MEDEKDAFYVVRKGDIVGVYKNFTDFQPLLYGPNVAVFKGYRLPKVAEEYLAANGLNNAIYSVGASDVQSELFCQLVPCPFQVNGLWRTKTENMTSLCKIAKELKDKFTTFQICHVEREFNTDADAQANMGIHLQLGEVQEEVERR